MSEIWLGVICFWLNQTAIRLVKFRSLTASGRRFFSSDCVLSI
ncbi:Uncharacterised protein [Vibrio cholerae]|nr:Uncharacterised protein [Vibrio cholerae]CSB87893.1 Uncharacterised protein [Vibrio cholerae]